MEFTGLDPDAPRFYAELRERNTREWWSANRARYDERVRTPFEALGAALEPEFGPVKVFRPYRDVRFGADKSPYKLHIGMVSRAPVAHYLQLADDGMLVGGGVYDVPPAALTAFRGIVDDPRLADDLGAVIDDVRAAGFDLMRADALKTAPRGFRADHPRIDLLRLKRLAIARAEPLADWMWTPDALEVIRERWRTVSTWCDWLRESLGAQLAEAALGRRGTG